MQVYREINPILPAGWRHYKPTMHILLFFIYILIHAYLRKICLNTTVTVTRNVIKYSKT